MILDIATVTALRAGLWSAGFRPVPVFSANHPVKSPGKQPLGEEWQIVARQDPPFCVSNPAVTHALNTGILCDGQRPIDLDLDDPEKAEQCKVLALEMLGPAPIRYRENSPRVLLVYAAAEGAPGKRSITGATHTKDFGCKIEVLGKGQQFVAFGIHHPSGADLRWSRAPGDIQWDDLTRVTEAQITGFLTACAPIIGAAPPPPTSNGIDDGQERAPGEPQANVSRITSAVLAIPNTGAADWDEWIRTGMAIFAATGGGQDGFEAWDEWSARNDAYDGKATRERWQHFAKSPPTGIGAGTIFRTAAENGWADPRTPPPPGSADEYGTTTVRTKPGKVNGSGNDAPDTDADLPPWEDPPEAPPRAEPEPAGPPPPPPIDDPAYQASQDADPAPTKPKRKKRAKATPPPLDQDWQRFLMLENGEPIANLANVLTTLRSAPDLANLLAYDQMQCQPVVLRRLEGCRRGDIQAVRPPLQDPDVAQIQEWLQHNGMPRIGAETVNSAADAVAREHAFHPVRDYLRRSAWDRVPRLDQWLAYYLGAETQPAEYLKAVGRMWLVSMVARVMVPGCKCDYMVVLEDPRQGSMKSTALSVLGGDWYGDSLPELHGGDAVRVSTYLQGLWLIEVGEMSAMAKAESAALKHFLTKRIENYLPKYARRRVNEPRQCVFSGTTNEEVYLRDETGDRRSWPVRTGRIDLDALRTDRDQLFFEAVAAYDAGEPWWPDPEMEAKFFQPEQAKRQQVRDAWADVIGQWLNKTDQELREGKRPVEMTSIQEVAREALGIEAGKLTPSDQHRIAKAMRANGFIPGQNKTLRWWERKQSETAEPQNSAING